MAEEMTWTVRLEGSFALTVSDVEAATAELAEQIIMGELPVELVEGATGGLFVHRATAERQRATR